MLSSKYSAEIILLSGEEFVLFSMGSRKFRIELLALTGRFNLGKSELLAYIEDFLSHEPDEEAIRETFGAGIDEAIKLAADSFYGKYDIDGNPAVLHALEVGRMGITKDEQIVGYIHDIVEDFDYTFEDLESMGYSSHVVATVRLCTRSRDIPYEDYLQRILNSGNQTAINVKHNDLRHNLKRGQLTEEKARANHDEATLSKIQHINLKHLRALELLEKTIIS